MKRLISQCLASILGLWLATLWVKGVKITAGGEISLPFLETKISQEIYLLILAGLVLGLLNYFLKPVLKLIALPLQFLTFGLFTLVINMILVWIVDILFLELEIFGLAALFWTSMIVWILNIFFSKF